MSHSRALGTLPEPAFHANPLAFIADLHHQSIRLVTLCPAPGIVFPTDADVRARGVEDKRECWIGGEFVAGHKNTQWKEAEGRGKVNKFLPESLAKTIDFAKISWYNCIRNDNLHPGFWMHIVANSAAKR
jgi:hypothetical protein